MNKIVPIPWQHDIHNVIPENATTAVAISKCATQLSSRDQHQIAQAFNGKFYEMGVNYLWEKTAFALKKELSTVGVGLLGEMLGKADVEEDDDIDDVVTTRDAIKLAEELGIVGKTDALRLRQTHELVKHFFDLDEDEAANQRIDDTEALNILKHCIRGVLGREKVEVAKPFVEFRESLENTTLSLDDPNVDMLQSSPYFFYKLTVSVLMNAAKKNTGAHLEHSLANINLLIPIMWPTLSHAERWQVGHTYAELFAEGKTAAVSGIKGALLKVKGFDFVPENLRSDSFVKAADDIIRAHEGTNNFYNEPAPVKNLARLGSTIPTPALPACFSALIAVVIGNSYGVSWDAATHANSILSEMTQDRWEYYLNHVLPNDTRTLGKLSSYKPLSNWMTEIVQGYKLSEMNIKNSKVERLLKASKKNDGSKVQRYANELIANYYGRS
ncbi:MAG: hypothetical protein MK175_08230 [Pseudoalteromonas sp.]|uniref:hypothetical protein n=1 Tax=Pseudoalteromonas sp. TaxID=53249 RepID=UPI0025DD4518|nr:hypothetical protein [Pseudoalteromonas sp.]MCH2087157.1 hypothetical protein [Pseudoalteromonas sp.]